MFTIIKMNRSTIKYNATKDNKTTTTTTTVEKLPFEMPILPQPSIFTSITDHHLIKPAFACLNFFGGFGIYMRTTLWEISARFRPFPYLFFFFSLFSTGFAVGKFLV